MVRQFLRFYLTVVFPIILLVALASWASEELVNVRNFTEQVRRVQQTLFDTIYKRLAGESFEQWKSQIDTTRLLYPTGLALQAEDDFFESAHPGADELQRFRRGEVAYTVAPASTSVRTNDKPGTRILWFQRVRDTNWVLSNQVTLTESNQLAAYLYYLLFAVVAAAPILWFWFRPFWRDLEYLGRVTSQIGMGNFSVQATPVRSSAVKPFAAAIDQMSLRIGELIDLQRRLTNSVAHELTTPITQLAFALTMLREVPDPEKARALVDGMSDDLLELDSLVAELLEYARLEHTAVFEPEAVDLKELIDRARLAVGHLPNMNPAVVLELDDGEVLSHVRCDAHQIQRAVVNLLRNALRYAQSRVLLSAQTRDDRASICVDDDGPGIPVAEQARLFEPFARIDASRTRDTGGHGLGLAIVQQVAKLHGGIASIEVSPLGGARVKIEW